MKKVLMCGDVNVDIMMGGMESLPEVDREVLCRSYEVTIGSSAAICACNYASLGGKVSLLGLCGTDDHGDYMVKGLKDFGVDVSFINRTSRIATGVTVNLIYQNTRTQVTYPGTISEFEANNVGEDLLSQFNHVHFAGPYQQTRFRPAITRLLEVARSIGVSTSLDPQWDSTEQWEYMSEWLPRLDYLFVNEDEARSISGRNDLESACLFLAKRTPCPLVKRGSDGVLYCVSDSPRAVAATTVNVVDTTGAGDAFAACFLFSTLEKGADVDTAVRLAATGAARSCMFSGGVNARSSYQDVLALLPPLKAKY